MKRLYFASLNQCNEDCLFCVRRGDESPLKFINTKEAKKILSRKKKEGYQEIFFDGGEPTLRDDLVELIRFAKSKKFKSVNILTNGVLLSDERLTKKILSVKNNKNFTLSFSVSLHSHKKNISEKLVNQKNTFDKTIKGIENLIKNKCQNISLYHIITKENYRDLPNFVDFVYRRFPQIKNITFSFIYPAGAALKNKNLFPSLSKTEPYFRKALQKAESYHLDFTISTCGTIPLCFLEGYEHILLKQQELDQPEKVGLIDADHDLQYQLASKSFHRKTKIKASFCQECFYYSQCGGIWRTYVELYGLSELKPIKKKRDYSKNVLLVVTGWSCNNNCLFCSTVADRNINRTTSEIIRDLEDGFKKGYRVVEFIGGEVSIRPDFLFLVSSAKKIGFKNIRLTTNGRRFSYREFIKKAYRAGLRTINFSLYGHCQELHDGITRTPYSFEQCLQGIKNALDYPELEVVVNTVVSKINYQYLEEIAKLLNKIGVKEWHLLELLPDGRAAEIYDKIFVSYKALSPFLNKTLAKAARYFKKIDIFDFPFCIFESRFLKQDNIVFFTPRHRYEDINQIGFNPARVDKKEINGQVIYDDKYKVKPSVCRKCKYFLRCGGITKPYFAKYKDREIKILAQKHKLLYAPLSQTK